MKPFDPMFPAAALRTLQASRWAVWMARMFGEKVIGEDGEYRVVAYRWRGKLYLTDAGAQ
jgi:hypothetical protein